MSTGEKIYKSEPYHVYYMGYGKGGGDYYIYIQKLISLRVYQLSENKTIRIPLLEGGDQPYTIAASETNSGIDSEPRWEKTIDYNQIGRYCIG